jgi:biopolymer transport protein ExbD
MADFETEGKPNLTPMLDMVFQLITFFMVVANFKAASIAKDLELPVLGSARPVDTRGLDSVLILNIDKEGNLKAHGRAQPIREFIDQEAQIVLLSERRYRPELEIGQELPTLVVVRADRGTKFRDFNRVIRTCQEFGFRQFALKADMPKKQPEKRRSGSS